MIFVMKISPTSFSTQTLDQMANMFVTRLNVTCGCINLPWHVEILISGLRLPTWQTKSLSKYKLLGYKCSVIKHSKSMINVLQSCQTSGSLVAVMGSHNIAKPHGNTQQHYNSIAPFTKPLVPEKLRTFRKSDSTHGLIDSTSHIKTSMACHLL